jgi:hypothetical protein
MYIIGLITYNDKMLLSDTAQMLLKVKVKLSLHFN